MSLGAERHYPGIGPEAEIAGLREKMSQWNIKYVLWDMDGTLVDSRRVFVDALTEASGILLFGLDYKYSGVDNDAYIEAVKFKREWMDKILWGLRPEFGIKPEGVEVTVSIAAKILGITEDDPRLERAVQRVREIYITVPGPFAGAIETVDRLNAAGVTPILCSHSLPERVEMIKRAHFSGKFAAVAEFDISIPKSVQWKTNMAKFGIEPGQVLGIGDDPSADTWPLVALGARTVLITDHYVPFTVESMKTCPVSLSVYRERVTEVPKIAAVVGALLNA